MPTSAPSKQGEKMPANFYDFTYYRRIKSAAAMIDLVTHSLNIWFSDALA